MYLLPSERLHSVCARAMECVVSKYFHVSVVSAYTLKRAQRRYDNHNGGGEVGWVGGGGGASHSMNKKTLKCP